MILKWMGVCLLLCLAAAYSMAVWRRWREVSLYQQGWIALLEYVRSKICCFGTPLQDILTSADEALLAGAGIPKQGSEDFAALCHRGSVQLGNEGGALLRALGDEIGTIWRTEQVERLDYYIEALREQQTGLSSVLRDRVRLHATLSVCSVLAIILLIW